MPTAAGGQLHRHEPAWASAALGLGTAGRDTSGLWRGGKGEPSVEPPYGQRARSQPPQPPPPAAEQRHSGTHHTLRWAQGTKRSRCGAVPHPAQRQHPPVPQRPRRRHIAPSAPPPPAHWLSAALASGESRHGGSAAPAGRIAWQQANGVPGSPGRGGGASTRRAGPPGRAAQCVTGGRVPPWAQLGCWLGRASKAAGALHRGMKLLVCP